MRESLSLGRLAEILDAELRGDAGRSIRGLAALDAAGDEQLSFYNGQRDYREALRNTRAGAVLLAANAAADCPVDCLVLEDPYLGYARSSALFAPVVQPAAGVHPSAVVEAGAVVAPGASIGPHCFVGEGAEIAKARLDAGVSVGRDARVGTGCHLHAGVVLEPGVVLGCEVTVHGGAVLGADGFGFAFGDRGWEKIFQLGGVRIGDEVEIGAQSTIDRGALGDTVIGTGVKIDNQVHIAHNVQVGAHTAIAGCTGIAGGVRIGARCRIGGGCGISNGLRIADGTVIHPGSTVYRDIEEAGAYCSGARLQPARHWRRTYAATSRLPEILRRIDALEKKAND